MVESSNRIGGTLPLPGQPGDGRVSRGGTAGQRAGSRDATPSGPRGSRMLSPDVSVDQLDRSAPRGTYLDILV